MKDMKSKVSPWLLVAPIVLGVGLLLVFQLTDPLTVGPAGILGVFLLIYLFALSVLFIALHFGVSWVSRYIARQRNDVRQRELRVGARKAYYIASLLAFAPVLLLAMRSFAELKIMDVALVLVLLGVVTFYILKRS